MCSKRRCATGCSIVAIPDRGSPATRPSLAAATGRSAEPLAQKQQADHGLRVAAVGDQSFELGERLRHDLDALVVRGLRALVAEPRGQEQVALLVGEAGRQEHTHERLPVRGRLADLLGELALRRLEHALALLVQLAGRQLEQRGLLNRLARLANEVDPLAVVGHDGHRAGMLHDLPLGFLAVVEPEAVHTHPRDAPVERNPTAEPLEGHQRAPAPRTSASVTSSICSSASTVTDSSGSWFRSVPLARLTTGRPAATRAFASLAPPVEM